MSASRPVESVRNAQQWIIVALFMGLLWLPTVDTFLHLDHAQSPNENRAPARYPVFRGTLEGLRDYVAGLEAYYDDHFGFRKRLIRWNNHWKHQLFKESYIPNVITGRDGWLYYSGDDMIDNCLGVTEFKPHELEAWKKLIETRRDWATRHGIHYLFVICPNKESVYPEHLPEWMVKRRPTTKLDQFFGYMKTNSNVEVLDLRPLLIEAKKSMLTYQLTDTHWNFDGAFIAHQELIRTLANQMPGLRPLPASAFKRTSGSNHGGDLARMLGQEKTTSEKVFPTYEPLPPLVPIPPTTAPELLPGKKWEKFMDPMFTVNTNKMGTAIFFRDSFSGYWIPFIGQYFNKVVYFSEKNWEPAFIEREKPVLIVDEMVERYFYTADPVELEKQDGLK